MSLISEEWFNSVEKDIDYEILELNCVLKDPTNGNIKHEQFVLIKNYHLGWKKRPDLQPQVHKNLICAVIRNLQQNILLLIGVLRSWYMNIQLHPEGKGEQIDIGKQSQIHPGEHVLSPIKYVTFRPFQSKWVKLQS